MLGVEAPPASTTTTAVPWRLVAEVHESLRSVDVFDDPGASAPKLHLSNPNHAQYLIVALFAGMAVGQLVCGPLSDALGRKKVLYWGIGLYLCGSLLCLTTCATRWHSGAGSGKATWQQPGRTAATTRRWPRTDATTAPTSSWGWIWRWLATTGLGRPTRSSGIAELPWD